MCGIVGVLGLEASAEKRRAIVEQMADRVSHRGPDGGGVFVDADAAFGMKRLAIVDVAHGQQPMATEDGSIIIVFNGEIYNARALRAELEQQGVRFRTRSDTEVILRLYERSPHDVERHLVGMWAFAIHDRKRRRVVLSRDRFGIKPLFIADTGTTLAFASELRAFDRNLSPFQPCFEIDHAAAHAMVSWSFVPEGATIFRGIKRLLPATRMTIDLASRSRKTESYWHLEPSLESARVRSIDEAAERVEALLEQAVREHLESDVPIATFLSGGIDSSLVTALAAKHSSRPIRAYSIGFHERNFDESPFAKETADRLGLESRIAFFDENTARKKVPDVLLAYDEPFGDSSSLATYLLCEHVAKDFKVALGGDGGDEVFAGYKKYLVVKLRRPFAHVPSLRDGLAAALGRISTDALRGPAAWTTILHTIRRLHRGLNGSDAEVYAELTQVAPLARTAPLMRTPADASPYIEAARVRFSAAHGSELQRTLACELSNTLCNDMLVKVDRASMVHHLEARVPFLDHRLVEFGIGLPERFTLNLRGKRVLREMHRRRFGSKLANRAKHGFGVPVQEWLRGPFDTACTHLFDAKRLDRYGILSSAALGHGRFREWVEREPYVVWHAFALAAWIEANLGDGPESVRGLLSESKTSRNSTGRGSGGARVVERDEPRILRSSSD